MARRIYSLEELDGSFLAITARRGMMGVHFDEKRAHGVYFLCPRCIGIERKQHPIVALFNEPEVHPDCKPDGRWEWIRGPFENLTIPVEVYSRDGCGWRGRVYQGFVNCD